MSAALPIIEREKRCSKCKEWWPADREFFHSCKRQPDGLSLICIACYHELPCVKKRKVRQQEEVA